MHIICLTPLEPGVYNDHSADHITTPPAGWAYIPAEFPLPSTFPRLGSLEAEVLTYTREVEVPKTREVPVLDEEGKPVLDEEGNPVTKPEEFLETESVPYTMLTVTAMTEGTLPEPVPETEPTPTDDSAVWEELDKAYQEGVDSV